MTVWAKRPLFVCYEPGLNARRLDRDVSAFLCELREAGSAVELRSRSSTGFLPTMVRAMSPH